MKRAPKGLLLALSLALAASVVGFADEAHAQGKAKPKVAAKAKKQAKSKAAAEGEEKAGESGDSKKEDAKKSDDEKADESKTTGKGAGEGGVKAAGTEATEGEKKKKGEPDVVKVEESKKEEGVKTYTFSAIEVEGRLKSPQIIYFLRRVRAEFEAGALGHRSFMPELSDTRRSPALK
jgi:hypothetical protein